MKRIMKMAALVWVLVLGSSLRNQAHAQYYNDNEVSYQTFYDDLSPYGQWIDYPGYGYVWVPDAGPDFRPYSTGGHWVWTDDYEWMWVSDYDWGWAPFHYGRWEEDPYYGWFWIPGYEWAPAWVVWRDGGDYYGWAPLRPGITISINFNFGSYNPPYDYWCFVPRRYITSPRIYDYCVDRRSNLTIINYTTIINYNNYSSGYGFRSGPRRYEAERYCGRINPVRFRETYSPGRTTFRNNEVSVYRPRFSRDNDRVSAPRTFERYDRNNGNFRNRNAGNEVRRDDNGFRRNENIGNNGVDRRDRSVNNQPFRRNDQTVRQPQIEGNNDRRKFDRNDNRNDNNGGQFDRRVYTPTDRNPYRPGNGNNDNMDMRPRGQQDQPRSFDRRMDNNGNNGNDQIRRKEQQYNGNGFPQPRVQQEQPRQFERRMDNNGNNGNDQIRRREQQYNGNGFPQPQVRQEQPRQFERRSNPDQVDRQPSVRTEQPRQEQSRGFERRDNSQGQQDGENSRGNGKGKGRGRF